MSDFKRPDIRYRPLDIDVVSIPEGVNQTSSELDTQSEDETIANKLMDHLAQIKAYHDRIDAIDYLINNAKSLSGNLKYSTEDTALITSIQALGGEGSYVDFSLFEKAVDIVINGYKEMALVSLTGAAK